MELKILIWLRNGVSIGLFLDCRIFVYKFLVVRKREEIMVMMVVKYGLVIEVDRDDKGLKDELCCV